MNDQNSSGTGKKQSSETLAHLRMLESAFNVGLSTSMQVWGKEIGRKIPDSLECTSVPFGGTFPRWLSKKRKKKDPFAVKSKQYTRCHTSTFQFTWERRAIVGEKVATKMRALKKEETGGQL